MLRAPIPSAGPADSLAHMFADDDEELAAAPRGDAAFTYRPQASAGPTTNAEATQAAAQTTQQATQNHETKPNAQNAAVMAHGCPLAQVYVDEAPGGVAGAALLFHATNQTVTLLVYDPQKRPLVTVPLHALGDDALAPQPATDGVYVSFLSQATTPPRRWSLLFRTNAEWVATARNTVLLRAAATATAAAQTVASDPEESLVARRGDTIQVRANGWRVQVGGATSPVLASDNAPFHTTTGKNGDKLELPFEGDASMPAGLVAALDGCPKGARRVVAARDDTDDASILLWDVEVVKLKKRREPAELAPPSPMPAEPSAPPEMAEAAKAPATDEVQGIASNAGGNSLAERMARISAAGGRGGLGMAIAINPRSRSSSAVSDASASAVDDPETEPDAAVEAPVPMAVSGGEILTAQPPPPPQMDGGGNEHAPPSSAVVAADQRAAMSAPAPSLPPALGRAPSPQPAAWWYGPCSTREGPKQQEEEETRSPFGDLASRLEETQSLVRVALSGAVAAAVAARRDAFIATADLGPDDGMLSRGDVEVLLRDAFDAAAEAARAAFGQPLA